MNYLSGRDLAIVVPLKRDGEPVVPDAGNVFWELRGHSGAVISPKTTISGIVDSVVPITIAAANVTLSGHLREQRTLLVSGIAGGFPFDLSIPFTITGFLNLGVTAKDVRKFIGISEGELPDSEIDLVDAYFDLPSDADVASALAGDEKSQRAANKAVVAQAVLNLLPGLPQLLSKRETDGTSEVERFTPDFQDLEAKARAQRDNALDVFRTTEVTDVTLVALSTRTDPITGS